MKYSLEKAQDVLHEMIPLLELHWREIAHYKDIPLEPDAERYFMMQDAGMLRVFTVRDQLNGLVGYGVYIINTNPHYSSSKQALQDILFIRPEHRGRGGKFITWCDEQLKADGCQVVYQHIKKAHNFGPMLERHGYELVDLIYAKRLDK